MAHAAQIDNGLVKQVIVVPDDLDETESDAAIQEFCDSLGLGGTWIRTSYNNNIRTRFAGIDFRYDAEADEFLPPEVITDEDTP